MARMSLVFKWIASPVDPFKLVANEPDVVANLWENHSPRRVRLGPLAEDAAHAVLTLTERQLAEFFQGELPCADAATDWWRGRTPRYRRGHRQ